MNRNVKSGWLKKAAVVLLLLIIAFLSEYLVHFKAIKAWKAHDKQNNRVIYTADDLICENVSFDEDHRAKISDAPHMILAGWSGNTDDIAVCLKDVSSNRMPIQIYFTLKNEEFSDEHVIKDAFDAGRGVSYVEINLEVTSLRVDIGEDEYDSYVLEQIIVNPTAKDYLRLAFRDVVWIRVLVYFLLMLLICVILTDVKAAGEWLFRHRWMLGMMIIAFCVIFKLHGSSMGSFAEKSGSADPSNLWGEIRKIRTDEYAVFTQMALSQVKNGFQWFSDLWGYQQSDMFLTYGQPVANIVTLYRPFSAGYLLLGAEYGLAFFWSARFVFLFLVSFEFGRLITKDNRRLALIYSLLVSLSPLVQWWYSTNELVEMLIFGQGIVLLVHLYLAERDIRKKIVYTLGLVLCSGGFAMTLYPAWMIPLFWIFVACVLAVLLEKRKEIHLKRIDGIILISGIILLAASLLYIFKTSSQALDATLNTVYPGKRRYYGGNLLNVIRLFGGWTSWIWTIFNGINPCEAAEFINFYPLGMIFSIIVLLKQKKRDIWLIFLNAVNIFLTAYMLLRLPSLLGDLTLISHSSYRVANMIGFLNLVILIRAMAVMDWKTIRLNVLVPAAMVFVVLGLYSSELANNGTLSSMKQYLVIIIGVYGAYVLVNWGKEESRQRFLAYVLLLSLVGGGMINPISSGLDSLYGLKYVQAVEEVNNAQEGTWAVVAAENTFNNLPVVVGAKCMNAVATYPNRDLWEVLGFSEKEDLWNRYAHIRLRIQDEMSLEMINADSLLVGVTIEKLKEIGVNYILSWQDLSNRDGIELLRTVEPFTIWKIL